MKQTTIVSLGGLALLIVLMCFVVAMGSQHSSAVIEEVQQDEVSQQFFPGLATDFSRHSIAISEIVSGGPGKDGIPAISNPTFISVAEAEKESVGQVPDAMGVLVDFDGVQRFYPYTILVWHEIVNDVVGGQEIAVTFCPLCGSAIVYDRNVGGEIVEFGVSGLLWESNLLMYDKQSESLWSQSAGRAVVGKHVDTELDILRMQLIDFATLQSQFPDAEVMSEDTGFIRRYGVYPYGVYESSEGLYFPVSVSDTRFFSKEIMLAAKVDDVPLSIPLKNIQQGETRGFDVEGKEIRIVKDGFVVDLYVEDEVVPSYYEMWFSWATAHQENGVIWDVGAEN